MLNYYDLSRVFVAITWMIVFFNSGCGSPPERSRSQAPVIGVDDNDERMNSAIAKAKESFPKFVQNWQKPGIDAVSVKIAMETDTDGLEFIWYTPIKIEGDQITALCANEPEHIPGLRLGDERIVDLSKVSDWMIMQGGKCYGGYTIQVMAEIDPDNAPPFQFAEYP